MNEDEMVFEEPTGADLPESDPIPQEDAGDVPGGEEAAADACGEEAVEDFDLPADPMPGADPDPGASASADASGGLDQLRGELTRLQGELDLREARLSRMGEEMAEFSRLYPDVPMTAIPDGVWADVMRGIPLSAAFAVEERRRVQAMQRAEQRNLLNRQRSPGELKPAENDVYSPAEVRAMSREEVRANYSKIVSSMQKWH